MSGSVFDLAERRLDWLDRRQSVLAQNIANANTPGFKAQDLDAFSAQLSAVTDARAVTRTDPMHLAGTLTQTVQSHAVGGEQSPDGNDVALDTQLGMVSDTDTQQELVSDIYKKYAGLFRLALGR